MITKIDGGAPKIIDVIIKSINSTRRNLSSMKLIKESKTSNIESSIIVLLAMITILIGLFLALLSQSVIAEGIIGIGILISGYGFMKLSNK
jgi:hypothetical protein